jgi:hypothetical protein
MDYIDTRDLAETREELRKELEESYKELVDSVKPEDLEEAYKEWAEDNENDLEKIKQIDQIESEVSEFEHGETLIPECEFENYVEDMVRDCGYIDKDIPSWIEINWEKTADNLRYGYSTVEYDGYTYYYRN